MGELFKILQPLQFMQTFLNSGIRPDGRKFDKSRDVLMSCDCVTTANGSALVKFGTSSVICGITTSLTKPSCEKPEEGILEIDVRFSNTCSTDIDNPDRTTASGYVRECIKKIFYHSNIMNLKQLCLIPRKHAWKIFLEIICLNMDGCIVDLSLLSALSALKKCKLRKYEIETELDILTPTDKFEKLNIKCFPILSTFAIIENNLLIDPNMNEEELSDTLIRIAVDSDSSHDSDLIYLLEITGSNEIEEDFLKDCYNKALKRAKFLKSIILKHTEDRKDNSTDEDLIKYEAM